jgi:small conductance mechanosensitive channel
MLTTALWLSLIVHAVEPDGSLPEPASDPAPVDPGDETAERALAAAFARIDGLGDVAVEVRAGVARITGEVADPGAVDAARVIAARVPGLLWVDDRLVATTPPSPPPTDPDVVLADRLRKLYGQVPAFSEVAVEVGSGVVHLTGETPSADAQRAAVELASKAPGAVYVDDRLRVAHSVEKRVAPAVDALQSRSAELVARLPLYGIGLALLVVAWFASRWISAAIFANRWASSKPLLVGLAQQSARAGIFLAGVIVVLDLLDLTTVVGAMLGTAGILGVAIGFAFRDIIENYLASIILSVRQPFAKGDLVDVAGHQGRVARLTMRETVLATADGNHVRVPNATVFKSVLTNYTTNPVRRFTFKVGIAVDEDLRAVKALCRQALADTPGVLAEPAPAVTIDAFADSSVTLNLAAWVNQREVAFGPTRTAAMASVKERLDAAGVDQPEQILRVFTGELVDNAPPTRRRAARARGGSEPPTPPEPEALPDREAGGEVDLLR